MNAHRFTCKSKQFVPVRVQISRKSLYPITLDEGEGLDTVDLRSKYGRPRGYESKKKLNFRNFNELKSPCPFAYTHD
jgi:hypothetical protein